MTLPLILLIAILVIYPAFYSLHLATLNKSMQRFVGLGNFEFLFKRETFWLVVEQSCIFAITAVVFKALIGFIVAHFVHNVPAKGQRKWRGMLLVPWVIPPAMSTLAWLWLFDPSYSAFNYTLSFFGIGPISWTGDAYWARFSVILVNIWFGAPFFMIMYLASLKSVPEQLYEAAAIDGANWWQRIWYVTLPMMRNIIAITTLFSLIVTFANFDIVRILTSRRSARPHAYLCDLGVPDRYRGRRHSARRQRLAVHVPDTRDRGGLHPARYQQTRERSVMASTLVIDKAAPTRNVKYGSMSRDRAWALRWSYFFLTLFAIFSLRTAALHADHLAQEQCRDFGGDQSLVGISSDAFELRRTADIEPVPDVLPELRHRFDLRRDHHHADQRAGRIRPGADAVLGFGDARDRSVSHLPHSGHAAVHSAVQDVRGVWRLDRNPADQSMVRAVAGLSDPHRAVLPPGS